MFWRWGRVGVCAGALLAVATWSAAEDLNPSGYRGLAKSTSAEWDFTSNQGSVFLPDGDSVPLVVGDFAPVLGAAFGVTFPSCLLFGPSWVPGGIAGAGAIACNIPNWHDNEPLKRLRVQVTYKGPKPSIRLFCFLGVPGGSNLVTETLVAEVADTTLSLLNAGGGYFYQDWECRPNPDWEQVVVDVPSGTVIDQLVVDTISSTRKYPVCQITPTLITSAGPHTVTITLEYPDGRGSIAGGSATVNGGDVSALILQLGVFDVGPTSATITIPVDIPSGIEGTFEVRIFVQDPGSMQTLIVRDGLTIKTPP